MYQEERLKKIIKWLETEEVLSNQELMGRLHISRDTARRDIVKLTEEKRAVRTHGGIARADFVMNIGNYQTRMADNMEGKRRIGTAAAKYLHRGELCFMDASTHMKFLCENLKEPISVYTHSLDNLEYLAGRVQVEVHGLGGILNRSNRFFYGYPVWEALHDLQFDQAVLGAAAIGEDGIYFEDEEDAQIKKLAAHRSKRVVVLADYPKFQRVSKHRAIGFREIDVFITDRELPEKWKEILRREEVVWEIV